MVKYTTKQYGPCTDVVGKRYQQQRYYTAHNTVIPNVTSQPNQTSEYISRLEPRFQLS
jgi:hypothetical protein